MPIFDAVEIHNFRLRVIASVHFWRDVLVIAVSSIYPYDVVAHWFLEAVMVR